MCQYFSCIATQDLKILWLPEKPNDHEAIKEKYNIPNETSETQRNFVKIEIVPNTQKITRNKEDWDFQFDLDDTKMPEWAVENKKKIEKLAWNEWEKSVKINLVLDQERKTVTNGFIKADDSSHVIAYGSSYVETHGSSRVETHGSSQVKAHDSSHVEAYDSSHVEAYSSSYVKAYNFSHVKAHDSSHVEAYDSSQIKAHGSSHVKAYDSSQFQIKSNTATVIQNETLFVRTKTTVKEASP